MKPHNGITVRHLHPPDDGIHPCNMCGQYYTHVAERVEGDPPHTYLTFFAPYWCPNCDAHAAGCRNRRHPPGQCQIPPP